MKQLLVIGGASLDTLHLGDRKVATAGGAGMYTAMAARRCGAQVSMFAPRPDPFPEYLTPVAEHLAVWFGPVVSPAQLPQFEISYREGKTEYLKISHGAEDLLSPDMLPEDLSGYDLVHVIPVSTAQTQLSMVKACRQRGAGKISAGTCLYFAQDHPQIVSAIIQHSDYFFMNKQEAISVFRSVESAHTEPGKLLFITHGEKGADIHQGDTSTSISAISTSEIDPTGAGDTFCGATLANLIQNAHPVTAAHNAAALAAEMITQVGPSALFSEEPPPQPPLDERVRVNHEGIKEVGRVISTIPETSRHEFIDPALPPAGHPMALEYFYAVILQQFSFWSAQNGRYHRPLIARIGGAELKGSDYLFEAYRRQLEADPGFFTVERQANMPMNELQDVLRADDGSDPMPALDLHLELAQQYGRDMLALGFTPQSLLEEALCSTQPLATFFQLLDHVGGYKEDPLRKKSGLLATILNQRPERFFPLRDDESITPVIDYHLMRACLRVGLIEVEDQDLRTKLEARQIISPEEEWAVRYAAYRAIDELVPQTGKSPGVVDFYFFDSRRRCPEMTEPLCHLCQLDPVCAHYKELFQPVLRTSYY